MQCWTCFTSWHCFKYKWICLFVCVLFIMQDLDKSAEKNTKEDEAFQETNWADLTYGYNGKQQKRVNMTTFRREHHIKKSFISK